MRHSTIRSALFVALLAATGCSLLPTMDGEIQARRQNMVERRQSTPDTQQTASSSRQSRSKSQTSKSGSYQNSSEYQQSTSIPSSTNANGNTDVTVNQVNKITYFMNGGKSYGGYLGIGTSVAQLNAMLNISVTNSSNVHFSQVNKVSILHDDDEYPEGGNREITDVFLVFGEAVEQVNLLENVTINGASNIRIDQVNKVSLVDSSGYGRDGYLVFPEAGISDQLNILETTVSNSQDVRFDQINSIFIVDADDFEHLYRPTEEESYLQRQYQSRKRFEQANGKRRSGD